mmetsp:Transcript_40194/g.121576  ORF Transcript_40194/g.121576 Transcript_40194/m.121576 type:complete len:227 (-) Transcript_40194:354-1034(-)
MSSRIGMALRKAPAPSWLTATKRTASRQAACLARSLPLACALPFLPRGADRDPAEPSLASSTARSRQFLLWTTVVKRRCAWCRNSCLDVNSARGSSSLASTRVCGRKRESATLVAGSGGRAEARSFSPSSGSSHGSTSTSGGLPVVPPTRSKYSAFVLSSHSFHVAVISPCSFLSLSCAARSSSKSEPGALLTSRSRKGACSWRMGPATSAHVPIHAGSHGCRRRW